MKTFTHDLRVGAKPYSAPVIERVEFRTERGFAVSDINYMDAGEATWTTNSDSYNDLGEF